jgi:hypothetical protein
MRRRAGVRRVAVTVRPSDPADPVGGRDEPKRFPELTRQK